MISRIRLVSQPDLTDEIAVVRGQGARALPRCGLLPVKKGLQVFEDACRLALGESSEDVQLRQGGCQLVRGVRALQSSPAANLVQNVEIVRVDCAPARRFIKT